MKKVLGLFTLAAAIALPAAANEHDKQASDKQAGSTLMGCLEETGVAGGFVLAAGTEEGVAVSGSEDLEKHVGHTVKLTGEEYEAEGKTHFEVHDIEHIAATCEDAELAPETTSQARGANRAAAGAAARTDAKQPTERGMTDRQTARATLKDPQGETVGRVQFTGTEQGVLIKADLTGLPEGVHGFHIHETGKCEAPDFKSAGGHFNPTGDSHGFLVEGGPHAGDMPNFSVPASGETTLEVMNAKVTLEEGEENSLSGKALLVHSEGDDYKSQPSGDAGDRIACGVIE